MQRFKKYAMLKGNCDTNLQPVIFGARYGFDYVQGANPFTGKYHCESMGHLSLQAVLRAEYARSIELMTRDRHSSKGDVLRAYGDLRRALKHTNFKLPG